MKILFITIMVATTLIFTCCKKDKEIVKEVDVKSLLIGKWKLVQYRQGTEPWKDSTDTFYNFVSDTLVTTTIFNSSCNRRYSIGNPATGLGIKGINIFPNYNCIVKDWFSYNIDFIDNSILLINYSDEVGNTIVRKYEKFEKE